MTCQFLQGNPPRPEFCHTLERAHRLPAAHVVIYPVTRTQPTLDSLDESRAVSRLARRFLVGRDGARSAGGAPPLKSPFQRRGGDGGVGTIIPALYVAGTLAQLTSPIGEPTTAANKIGKRGSTACSPITSARVSRDQWRWPEREVRRPDPPRRTQARKDLGIQRIVPRANIQVQPRPYLLSPSRRPANVVRRGRSRDVISPRRLTRSPLAAPKSGWPRFRRPRIQHQRFSCLRSRDRGPGGATTPMLAY